VDKNDRTWTFNIKRGVAAAFELSWEELSENAKQLGCLLSLFALAPIPWSLVESVGAEQDPEDLEDARVELENLHLLQGEAIYQLHQLIREFFQEKLAYLAQANDLKRTLASVMVAMAKQIPYPPTYGVIESLTPKVPHLAEVATTLTEFLDKEDLAQFFTRLGEFYEGQGIYDKAKYWYEQCLSVTQNCLGDNHPAVAMSLNNLGLLYKFQGCYGEAERLYVQALELRIHLEEDNHSDIEESLYNLNKVDMMPDSQESCLPFNFKT
jgi:tetratricopeptide (TPR) repeat protein